MKKMKKRFILVCILVLSLCLAGCGLLQSDTTQLKDLLEDKYGEEFGVESYYYAGDMWAMCYPESDPTLLFQVRTDGNVTKISHDYYLQAVVEQQVNVEYKSIIQQIFPESYLSSNISAVDFDGQTANQVTLDSMIQYSSLQSGWTYIVLNIFIDSSQMEDENIKKEYAFFQDEIGKRVAHGELPDTIVKLYFGDASFVQECEDILTKTTWMDNEIYDKIENYPKIRIYFYEDGKPLNGARDYGGVDYEFEDYKEQRTEALSHE